MNALRLTFVVLGLGVLASAGCEPELGSPCDPSKAVVDSRVRQEPGKNDLVQSVAFDNCTAALCASIDGSRPFCTRPCEQPTECTIDDPEFTCAPIVQFGALGCRDFDTNPDCVDDDGSLSDSMISYCTTTRTHIEERDAQFNRNQ
jgi:hypothetical protein